MLSGLSQCQSSVLFIFVYFCRSSCYPSFYRGDVVFISNSSKDIETGSTVAFKIPERDLLIIHRIVEKVYDASSGEVSPVLDINQSESIEFILDSRRWKPC